VAASIAYERDLRAGDSRKPPDSFTDDFIGDWWAKVRTCAS